MIGSEWVPGVVGTTPTARRMLADWLKVVAAFTASRGDLDEWFAALPDMLSPRP